MSSSISFGGALGFALSASVVSILLAVLTTDEMNLWGWRVAFVTAIVPGLISLYLRCAFWMCVNTVHGREVRERTLYTLLVM